MQRNTSLRASRNEKKGVLVRTPASLKEALVRETARRGASLNDVAVGILADAFDVDYVPTNRRSPLPGSSPVVLLRMPEELKNAIQAEAFRRGSNTNDVILASLSDELGVPFESNRTTVRALRGRPRKGHTHGRYQRLSERQDPLQGQGARRHHRRRQLRQLPAPGRRVLQGRRRRTRSSRGSCTSTSAATTSRTSSSRPPSTSSRARSASTSPTRSGRTRTTRSSSPTCRRPASPCRAA